jgi:hypothetical protein
VERWEDGKRDGNHSPPQNKLIQESEGNEAQFQTPTKQK